MSVHSEYRLPSWENASSTFVGSSVHLLFLYVRNISIKFLRSECQQVCAAQSRKHPHPLKSSLTEGSSNILGPKPHHAPGPIHKAGDKYQPIERIDWLTVLNQRRRQIAFNQQGGS
jgi:hypothetical protein